jgi:hypothetical protein
MQAICSRLRSRTLRMAFGFFQLPLTMYATAPCLAMNSANDASVIYLPRTKAAPRTPFGAAQRLGACLRGRVAPSLLSTKRLWKTTKSGWNFAP